MKEDRDDGRQYDELETRLRSEPSGGRGGSGGIAGRTMAALAGEARDGCALGSEGEDGEVPGLKFRGGGGGWLAARHSVRMLAWAASVLVVLGGGGFYVMMSGILAGETEPRVAAQVDEGRVGVLRALVFDPIGDVLVDASRYVASSAEFSLEAESAVWRAELAGVERSVRKRLPWVELRGGGNVGDEMLNDESPAR